MSDDLKRIVVVDDDERMRRLMEANLTRAGYEVICADNGSSGLDLVQSLQPDLVILDVLLPGVDGFTVCQIIKEAPGTRHTPVVLVSAVYVTPEDIKRGVRIGAEEYLLKADIVMAKPVRMPRLVGTVQRLLGEEPTFPLGAEDRILLIEDDPVQADLAARLLRREAHRFDLVETGEEALTTLDPDEHVLVLCDYLLPGMSGLDVLRQVRARDLDAAFVLVTAAGSERVAAEALAEGADDYVAKPLQAETLSHVLQRNISKAKLRIERRGLVAQLKQSNVELMRRYTDSERQRMDLERLVGELRTTQDALVKAQRLAAVSETAVAVNHEINNPLAAIAGNAYLLLSEGGAGTDQARRRVKTIQQQCSRIQETTQKLARVCRAVIRPYAEGVVMLDIDASVEADVA